MPLASVTYGKYSTWVKDVVTYRFYECFSSKKHPCSYNKVIYVHGRVVSVCHTYLIMYLHQFIYICSMISFDIYYDLKYFCCIHMFCRAVFLTRLPSRSFRTIVNKYSESGVC